MAQNLRAEPREALTLPVQLGDGGAGVARNISASGVFFETDSNVRVGCEIDLEIDLNTPGGPFRLKASGCVVRIESRDGRIGVAVKLTASQLELMGE